MCVEGCECPRMEAPGMFGRIVQRLLGGRRPEAIEERRLGGFETASLGKGELFVRDLSAPCQIACSEGSVWVTFSGKPGDEILGPGERLSLEGEGKLIISAPRGHSRITICTREELCTRQPAVTMTE